MKLSQLCETICPIIGQYGKIEVTGLSADSRAVREGFLFAAVKGEQVDGARFIPSAIENGAAAILCGPETRIESETTLPLLRHDNPRLALALMSRRFYPKQPDQLVAITGTNGKSSIASFVRQIWTHLGHDAASVGTIGIETSEGIKPLAHTTPDPVTVSKILQDLKDDEIDHVAFEASSHGLSQYRLHGLKITAGAFTNISRDHLDYHESFEDYYTQKMRLFEEVMLPGAIAVISADHEYSHDVMERAKARGLSVMSVGRNGTDIQLLESHSSELMQALTVGFAGETYDITLPLAGEFQVENSLVAAGLVIACGACATQVFPMIARLQGAKGRLEKIALDTHQVPIFVDYAHTPDALENVLLALRPVASGKLVLVFGCGGDRDKGKRPLMGQVASHGADLVVITDDNPRSEKPDDIREEIMSACPGAINIGDRRSAIQHALSLLNEGDVLLIAGKGHETGQIIGDEVFPFSDHDVVRDLLNGV